MRIYRISKPNKNDHVDDISGKLCKVEVSNVPLHGILYPTNSNHACLFIHGTASNFYENKFITPMAIQANKNKIAFLTSNNRGSEGLKIYPINGACVEKFEDCVGDIDTWIDFLKSQGYLKISLIGHSLGSEKIVYYMNHGKNAKNVVNMVLAGFSDSFGWEMNYAGNNFKSLMSEAKELIRKGKGDQFLTSDWLSHGGVLPQSAKTFVNFFSENSALSKALPLRKEKLILLQKIDVPILGTISDTDEYTDVPIPEAIERLKNNNSNITVEQLSNTDHDYKGAEEKIAKIIIDFCASV